MDGSDTHSTQSAGKFVALLRMTFPEIRVVEVDERFTSLMAKRTLVEMGMKKKDRQKKENLDQVSAAIILQTYLEMKNG
jgi:putative Holliday junction resolvase